MPGVVTKKSFLQRQIPTLVGLIVLVVGMGFGITYLAIGPGVLAPRATPQTTPKSIKLTNVTDTSFTVSFLTDESTAGFIKYGMAADKLSSQASDDRDQLSGSVSKYTLHHITLRGLQAGTTYYYSLGTGSNASFDNNGQPFTVTTAKRGGTPSAAKTAYGTVNTASGTPAEGSIVYISIAGVGGQSSLVKNSGTWAIPLSNARTADGASYADITDATQMTVMVQGPSAGQTAELTVTVADSQPVTTIALGENGTAAKTMAATSPSPLASASPSPSAPAGIELSETSVGGSSTSTSSAMNALNNLLGSGAASGSAVGSSSAQASGSAVVVDLTETTTQTVLTSQPTIVGEAAPNVKVKIRVHSENEYEFDIVADGSGGFTLDLAKLQAQLEPGEHTVEYEYIDPATGRTVTKTETFFVASPTGSQIALASTSPTPKPSSSPKAASSSSTTSGPFGSGNPFPIGGTSSMSASASPSASPKAASGSSRVSYPATTSGIPVSGSVGMTVALIAGGVFFILAGGWSFVIARNLESSDDDDIE